jgi:hypothetical protein
VDPTKSGVPSVPPPDRTAKLIKGQVARAQQAFTEIRPNGKGAHALAGVLEVKHALWELDKTLRGAEARPVRSRTLADTIKGAHQAYQRLESATAKVEQAAEADHKIDLAIDDKLAAKRKNNRPVRATQRDMSQELFGPNGVLGIVGAPARWVTDAQLDSDLSGLLAQDKATNHSVISVYTEGLRSLKSDRSNGAR